MNAAQQNKAVGKLVDEMLGMPVGLPHALRRSAMCGAIHKFLTAQDTGDKYGNDLRNEYKRGFRDRGKKVDDRLATQDTGGGDGLLRQVLQYNLGAGDFDFSKLPSYDRNNVAFDAWVKLIEEIVVYLATRSQDTGEREAFDFALAMIWGDKDGWNTACKKQEQRWWDKHLASKKEGKV